jgi:hypothetical protein
LALDLERLKASVDGFYAADPDIQETYGAAIEQATSQLRESLPALCESDLAAVSFYIASLLAAARNVPLSAASEVLTDTAIGYSLGAATLLGMLP